MSTTQILVNISIILLSIIAITSYQLYNSWIEIFLLYHVNSYNLLQLLHYGLTADVFDGDSNYHSPFNKFNPMRQLRAICQDKLDEKFIKLKNVNSSSTATLHTKYSQLILQQIYPDSVPIIHQQLLKCFDDACKSSNNPTTIYC